MAIGASHNPMARPLCAGAVTGHLCHQAGSGRNGIAGRPVASVSTRYTSPAAGSARRCSPVQPSVAVAFLSGGVMTYHGYHRTPLTVGKGGMPVVAHAEDELVQRPGALEYI
jgi:hypothetical protein